MDEEVFDATPPDKIERLARICGQTNYWLAFGGGVDSADVTADMAALAMARRHECVPEVLEAFVGGSTAHLRDIKQAVFLAIVRELRARRHEWPWMRGAVHDGMRAFLGRPVERVARRAKALHVRVSVYSAMVSLAKGILLTEYEDARMKWKCVRLRN